MNASLLSQDFLQSQLDAIQDGVIEGVMILNEVGIILDVNVTASAMFGYEAEQLLGQSITCLMTDEDRVAETKKIECERRSYVTTIIGSSQKSVGRKQNGEEFLFRVSVREVSDGEHKFYTCILNNLEGARQTRREIVALHEQLREKNQSLEAAVAQRTQLLEATVNDLAVANQKLAKGLREREVISLSLQRREYQLEGLLAKERELGELRSRFVSMASHEMASHEFRTPLTTMLSSVEIIEMGSPDASELVLKHTRRIRESIGYLHNVLEDFLQLGKLDAQGEDLRVEEIDLKELINSLVDEMSLICKPGQDLELQFDGVNALTRQSANGLRVILTNLISNAIKYSGDGCAIDVIVRRAKDRLFLQIKDEGIGIPTNQLPLLFERFFRARNAENIRGTGLGLHIVSRYVQAMGGKHSVVSEEGAGTTITIELDYALPYTID